MNSNKIKETVDNLKDIIADLIKTALTENDAVLKSVADPNQYDLSVQDSDDHQYPSDYFDRNGLSYIEKVCTTVTMEGGYFIDVEEPWMAADFLSWEYMSVETLVEICEQIDEMFWA